MWSIALEDFGDRSKARVAKMVHERFKHTVRTGAIARQLEVRLNVRTN